MQKDIQGVFENEPDHQPEETGGLSTSTIRDDIYAFIFDQKGLMAGLGLQGSKITRMNP